ncbi:MAG: hypothetical protein ACOYLI_12685 [Synechococcus lacustris]
MSERQWLERLGPHVAPDGLYRRLKELPFAGRLRCDVSRVEAGSWLELLIDYEVGSSGIADGAWFKLTFKFYSDWALFQTSDPAGANYVSAELQAAAPLPGQSPSTVQSLAVRFDQKGHERPYQKAVIVDVVDGYLNAGDRILVRLGDRRGGGPGTRVQTFLDDDFRFRAYLDPLGTSRFVAVPGDLRLAVVAGAPAELRLHGPRFARPGVPVVFRLVLLDRWGNIAQASGGRLRVRLLADAGEGQQLEEREVTLPQEGWASATVPIAAPPPGSLVLEAELLDPPPGVGELCTTARLTVAADLPAPRSLYADLHVHAHDTVGTNSPASNAAYGRDVAGIDVLGYTANDFQISDANWALGLEAVEAFNEPGRFVVYPVQEWCGSSTAGGDHNVVFLGDAPPDFPYNDRGEHNRTLQWSADMASHAVELGRWPLEELWDAYVDDPENHLIIPHVGGRRAITDWHHPELERLVEITSAWGQFGWLYDDVIRRGYRLGVCGSGDEHRGRPGGGAPGVQVFGVRGGLTGVIADVLDRRTVGRALRARHTWATTGEHTALLVRCGEHLQGDAFHHSGPARIDYHLLGDDATAGGGWDEVVVFDHTGPIARRNLHAELGYASDLVRLRWGGARIPDRYRWADWRGRITVLGTTIQGFEGYGFEHPEEACWREGSTAIGFRSETYGDADSVEMSLAQLGQARFLIEGTISGHQKLGAAGQPSFHWEVGAEQLIKAGELRLELGGTELFLALERLTRQPLPSELTGQLTLAPCNAAFGWRPVYVRGRQRNDGKVWSSALFITFSGSGAGSGSGSPD